MSFVDRIRHIGQADTEPEPPDPHAVPPELAEYWPHTKGLDQQQRARIIANGGTVTLHPIRTQRIGVREDIRPPEVLTLDAYEHQVRLEQADRLRRDAEWDATIRKGEALCQLCGARRMGGQLAALTRDDGTVIRACAGSCAPVVSAEIQRRRWAGRLNQLLGTETP